MTLFPPTEREELPDRAGLQGEIALTTSDAAHRLGREGGTTRMRSSMILLGLGVLLAATSAAAAPVDCEPARCAVQTALDAECPCDQATRHGQHVSCVARVVNRLAREGMVPKTCKGKIRRCAARSVCGKPDFVTCQIPTSTCDTVTGFCTEDATVACLSDLDCGSRCKIKRDAERCAARGGTVGTSSTCCADCAAP